MVQNLTMLTLLVADRQQHIRAEAADARIGQNHRIGFARQMTGNALIAIGERISGASHRNTGPASSPFDDVALPALNPAK